MSPLFRPRHNTLAQISLYVAAAGAAGVPLSLMFYARTPYARGMQDPVEHDLFVKLPLLFANALKVIYQGMNRLRQQGFQIGEHRH